MELDLGYLVVAGLVLIPFFPYFRNFRIISAKDYLLMGTLFVAGSLASLIRAIGFVNSFLSQLLQIYIFLVLIITSLHLISENHKFSHNIIYSIVGLLTLALSVIQFLPNTQVNLLMEFILIDGFRVFTGTIMLYCYSSASVVKNTRKIRGVILYFQLSGLAFIIAGLGKVGVAILVLTRFLIFGDDIASYNFLLAGIDIVIITMSTGISIGIFFLSLIAPEHLIITHYQILRTAKIYTLFERQKMTNTSVEESSGEILDYISSLPKDLFSRQY